MKNEQQNDPNKKQEQAKKPPVENQRDQSQQQQKGDMSQKNQSSPGKDNSNITVGNDGKIGKAHDQWNKDSNKGDKDIQRDNQVKSNKTVTEPEIDAPIYDPEKTEKKIPQMEGNKEKK
jgi:hypothetical protein